jgi:hypothetical protein
MTAHTTSSPSTSTAGLPTPPHSPPSAPPLLGPATSDASRALDHLATLRTSYASMHMWTTKAQATLFELSLAQRNRAQVAFVPVLPPTPPLSTGDTDSAQASSADEDMDDAVLDADTASATEPVMHAEDEALPRGALVSARTRLVRRKQGMQIALELRARKRRGSRSRSPRLQAPSRAPSPLAAEDAMASGAKPPPVFAHPPQMAGERVARVLALFNELVGVRMESCRRIEALVRDAPVCPQVL